ncbi:hypothetical protein [Aurantimonas endophytica]|uniref:Uncharacterized protein n=1 Tax=Aurantimonas endophytica TaxID=1522175 RepID=A0A7W6HDQ3_9HYPH|nr:hypothetical protein [Aurantimonas endophytica]MBB4003172.1 hypothetical protein [Aurantimonas endophytica]MCO6404042.1 hypothetical protein [Aurantimonas endophytica]
MQRILVVWFGVLAMAPAGATNLQHDEVIERWHTGRYVCKMGQRPDGGDVTEQEVAVACQSLNEIGMILVEDGYCWSRREQEWFPARSYAGLCDK